MNIKKKYNLEFIKTKHPEFRDFYTCRNNTPTCPGSYILSFLLTGLSQCESECFLEEIEASLNSRYYEEDYVLDWDSSTQIRILPPNVKINEFVISLSDMKQLLEEWIRFIKQ